MAIFCLSNRFQLRPLFASNIDPPWASKGAHSQKAPSGSGAVLEPPARVTGLDDIAMVREAVQHRGCSTKSKIGHKIGHKIGQRIGQKYGNKFKMKVLAVI